MAPDTNGNMIATYYLESDADLASVARDIITLETTGGWDGPGDPPPLFAACTGEVVSVNETAPGCGTVQVAFPMINFNLEESAFASLWLAMVGGGTHALLSYKKSRLVDFTLPDKALRHFPGPQFGMEGTRRLLDLAPGLPVIGTIVKPTCGLTADDVADLLYRMAVAGCASSRTTRRC